VLAKKGALHQPLVLPRSGLVLRAETFMPINPHKEE
jgi:hypothetical protein